VSANIYHTIETSREPKSALARRHAIVYLSSLNIYCKDSYAIVMYCANVRFI